MTLEPHTTMEAHTTRDEGARPGPPSRTGGRIGIRRRWGIAAAAVLLGAALWLFIRPIRLAVNGAAVGPWTAVDENELRRLNRMGYFAGDTVELQVLGTVPRTIDAPRLIKDLNRDDAVRAGVAGRAVYPGLPADSVYVLAGPYGSPLLETEERDIRLAARKRWSRAPRRIRLAIRDGDPPGRGELSRVAEAEYYRLWWEDDLKWPVYPVRIAGVFAERDLAAAGRRLRRVRSASLRAGIATHEVYPALEPGKVYVIIGPYRTERMQWASRRIPPLERETGERFRPRTLFLRPMP
ncbi:MAG TPA: hypothetical protein VF665_20005 [Longimicrobium sp.]|jgi:hypothetical protein|uniref:hypothetical protein n=1 Tax=Longimicrobium sp. TaxID=2029185 RepID=UPI002ED9AE1B